MLQALQRIQYKHVKLVLL